MASWKWKVLKLIFRSLPSQNHIMAFKIDLRMPIWNWLFDQGDVLVFGLNLINKVHIIFSEECLVNQDFPADLNGGLDDLLKAFDCEIIFDDPGYLGVSQHGLNNVARIMVICPRL